MPEQTHDGRWEAEVWDEWASCWPWSLAARERDERNRHMVRRAARHYHGLWDALQKRITCSATKELTYQTRLPMLFYYLPWTRPTQPGSM